MKPHMKVIQRNGVDIFVTSSMTYNRELGTVKRLRESNGPLELHVKSKALLQQEAQLRFDSRNTGNLNEM